MTDPSPVFDPEPSPVNREGDALADEHGPSHERVNAADSFGLTPRPKVRSKPADPLLGTDLGGVKIIRLVGEGGMGRVYEARQERPQRTVAVKVIRQGITSDKTLRRFEREAEFLAKLQHPGIAQIFVVGSYASDYGDVPFYVMEFIADAKPITNYCFANATPLSDRVRLFAEVCDAVSHGHDRGIIHRDLKPGNILIDGHGRPRVIDFGVARSTDSSLALTTMRTDSGHLVGTAHYMSPEQFGDNPDDLDPRADIYSLGVVLYELIAGVLPYEFGRKGIHEIARMVCEEAPTPLRRRGVTVPADVIAIVGKCLEKDRRDRYHSAGDLAGDLRRHLEGKPVHASKAVLRRLNLLRRFLPRSQLGWGLVLLAVGGIAAPVFTGLYTAMPARSLTTQLDVGAEWVSTGMAIEQGDCYSLVVRGNCSDDAGTTFGPDGTCPVLLRTIVGPPRNLPEQTRELCVVGQHPIRAVIARIGDMAWSFDVGAGVTFIAPASGLLSVRINEPPGSTLAPRGELAFKLDRVPKPRFVDETGRTSVYAQIDETDLLLIRADGLQWEYGGSGVRVGMQDGVFPTIVNGIAWWPSWSDPMRSSVLATHDFAAVVNGEKTLVIDEVTSRRGRVAIGKPADGALRIRFSDVGGAADHVGCVLLMHSASSDAPSQSDSVTKDPGVIPPVPEGIEEPDEPIESSVVLQGPPSSDVNDLSSWRVLSGKWGMTSDGRIRGFGDAAIRWGFSQSWPAEFSFKMKVLDGLRPRVSLGSISFGVGTAEPDRVLRLLGPISELSGAPFRYELNKEYAVTLRAKDTRLILVVDGSEICSAKLEAPPQQVTLELSAGDSRSTGTVEYWDMRWSN